MELKKKKFNRPFVMSLQLAVIFGGLGIWLLMFFNNGRVTVSLEIIKYLPYLFILLAILLAIFAIKKFKDVGGNFDYNEKGLTNKDTNKSYIFKDLNDLFYLGQNETSKDWYAGIAFRKDVNDTWTPFTKTHYNEKQVIEIEDLYNKARTPEVIQQLSEGKKVEFSYIPLLQSMKNLNMYGLKANLSTKTEPITLTKEELIFRDKKYSLREIEKIGGHTRTLKNGICYVLKTKSGKTIFEFEKFEVMSYQVFISAINKFASN